MDGLNDTHATNADVRADVQDRYAAGANAVEAALCCPVDYDPQYLKIIPQEVLDRDYGCGDPSRYVREGDVVLDLGSGGGKICFIASQIVGPYGKVIGVDMTDDMLELSRSNAPVIADQVGYANVEFKRGHIEDLKTDLDQLNAWLANNPVKNAGDMEAMETEILRLQTELPMIPDNSVDVIVSNCVLNLVSDSKKKQLFAEMFRVLKVGGRVAVSDIISDEDSPEELKKDARLWSGCISGALTEEGFGEALEEAGFHGVVLDKFEMDPWQIVDGIEYRSATYLAYKGKQGECLEKNQAVIYKGPWRSIQDDDGHVFRRGERAAVCEKTFNLLKKEPYADMFIHIEPAIAITERIEWPTADCGVRRRDPLETKKGAPKITTDPSQRETCC
ncbi:MAG: methyltransferase domain-containing protein [Acidimicrobiales bacterium]|nr:methyltransferase domain-containing protein [Hyphomonadaceae bacterium]RZV40122.1 MAG: methyltransferase domain-containing protein [Acidimicrobiales bacterium]